MQFLVFLSENPTLRLFQFVLLATAVLAVYLVFFVTRDVLLRSRSFFFQFISIILTAGLPIVGFLLYLLLRPSRTLKESEMEAMLLEVLDRLPEGERSHKKAKKSQKTKAEEHPLDSLLSDETSVEK
jgi:hypothetical protein